MLEFIFTKLTCVLNALAPQFLSLWVGIAGCESVGNKVCLVQICFCDLISIALQLLAYNFCDLTSSFLIELQNLTWLKASYYFWTPIILSKQGQREFNHFRIGHSFEDSIFILVYCTILDDFVLVALVVDNAKYVRSILVIFPLVSRNWEEFTK